MPLQSRADWVAKLLDLKWASLDLVTFRAGVNITVIAECLDSLIRFSCRRMGNVHTHLGRAGSVARALATKTCSIRIPNMTAAYAAESGCLVMAQKGTKCTAPAVVHLSLLRSRRQNSFVESIAQRLDTNVMRSKLFTRALVHPISPLFVVAHIVCFVRGPRRKFSGYLGDGGGG